MTRETKIGLLVGLAFIIVIGILLSDYNRNESQAAALNAVASDVQKGAATPHNGSTDTAVVPAPHAPARPVPTQDELHLAAERSAAANAAAHPAPPRTPAGPLTPAANNNPNGNANGNNSQNRGITRPDNVDRLLTDNPNILEPVDPNHLTTNPPPSNPVHQTVNGAKPYVAVAGDTVSKLAGRFLGVNTKANRDAILAINPTLKQNPNSVTVGKTYMIPAKPGTTASAPTPAAPTTPAVATTPAPTHDQHSVYIVKGNDSLWKIASEQLGDPGAVDEIKELNKDVLKGSDTLRPNMKLRLPAKPLASAG